MKTDDLIVGLEKYIDFNLESGELGKHDQLLLEGAVKELRERPVEVVEQGTLVRSIRVPDGWSWDDLGPFTGYWSGIRLQRGEPIVEQDGHTLLIRQAETSFEERQRDIYSKLSNSYLADANGVFHNATSVMVVHGFQGARQGYTWFEKGEQRPTVWLPGPQVLHDVIVGWLERSHKNPIIPRKVVRKRPPEKLPL